MRGSSLMSRRKEWQKHVEKDDKRPLVNYLQSNQSVIVCSTDSIYFPRVHKDKCNKCGRDIVCDEMFSLIASKVCLKCSPLMTELSMKEIQNEREYRGSYCNFEI